MYGIVSIHYNNGRIAVRYKSYSYLVNEIYALTTVRWM